MPGNGSTELAAIGARLRAAGDGALRRELLRGMRSGAAPLVVEVKNAAREMLPHRGGLNEHVAAQRVTVSTRLGARNAGVRLVTRAPDTSQTDGGYVNHPVFGHRNRWVHQPIPNAAGWWSRTLAERSPEITPELVRVMREVAAKIQGHP